MITKKMYFMDCHLAGRKYHDADEVWDELKVGNVLRLERDKSRSRDGSLIRSNRDRFFAECRRYIDFSTEIIKDRARRMIEKIKKTSRLYIIKVKKQRTLLCGWLRLSALFDEMFGGIMGIA